MSKIYLSDIIGFCNNVYQKVHDNNNISELDLTNKINTVIQNEKLNKSFKCNFVDILSLTKYYKTNELILLSSISFDFKEENKSWFYFLNSILLVMYNDYVNKKKDIKKELIENLSELLLDKLNENKTEKQEKNKTKIKTKLKTKFKEQIIIDDFNKKENKSNFYLTASKTLKIVLIIVENTNFEIYENTLENQMDKKFLIFYKHNEYYFPFIDVWNTRHYNINSFFVKELISKKEINSKNNNIDIIQKISEHSQNKFNKLSKSNNNLNKSDIEDLNESDIEDLNESDIEDLNESDIEDLNESDIEDLNESDIEESNKESEKFNSSNIKIDMLSETRDNEYKEYISNHKNTLFMSEAVNLSKQSKSKNKIEKPSVNTTVHKESSKLSKEDKQKIIDLTKKSMKLEMLQKNASSLGIIIVEKDKKTGKIKNKKKDDLYEEIKNLKI